MNPLTITQLSVNGQTHTALTDTGQLHFSLWVKGAAQSLQAGCHHFTL